MSAVAKLPPAVRRYLQELELHLKQMPGISPEDVLSDARDFLLADAAALNIAGEPPDEAAQWARIISRFGEPSQVAQRSAASPGSAAVATGYAPGWRICCTQCGRSAPLAATGAIRVGAKSFHKYTFGFCRDCRRLRFLRIIQDLEKTNLTDRLGAGVSPAQLRSRLHRPVATLVAIGIIVLLSLAAPIGWAMLAAQP